MVQGDRVPSRTVLAEFCQFSTPPVEAGGQGGLSHPPSPEEEDHGAVLEGPLDGVGQMPGKHGSFWPDLGWKSTVSRSKFRHAKEAGLRPGEAEVKG